MYKKKTSTKRRIATLLTTAAMPALFASAVTISSPTYAAGCAPLSIVNMKLADARPILENGYSRGVSFRILATVKNTNPTQGYQAHRDTSASFQVINSGNVVYQARQHNTVPMNRALRGNGTRVVSTGRIEAYKKSAQNNLRVTLQGVLHNGQCKDTYRAFIGVSNFGYDLMPVIQGRAAKRLSARITGPNESARPRPRPATGSGAPRPRR